MGRSISFVLVFLFVFGVVFVSGCFGPSGSEEGGNQTGQGNQTSPTGGLYVASEPTAASVYISGVYKGLTPLSVSGLSPGTYAVTLVKEGYLNYTRTAEVSTGQTTTVQATLMPLLVTGNLTVSTNPPGASLYINNTFRGLTPLNVTDLEEGAYLVKITREGYVDHVVTVNVSGQPASLSITLVPL